jgi:hypothetical protein
MAGLDDSAPSFNEAERPSIPASGIAIPGPGAKIRPHAVDDSADGRHRDLIEDLPATTVLEENPPVSELAQVIRGRGLFHLAKLRKLAHRVFSLGEEIQNSQANRMGH